MDTPLILHHYDFSNYSEKVRLVLGYKDLAWHSVTIPAYMPKPEYTPLTGGYRRTPALQIGADVYCDTRLIIEVLEASFPQPSLYSADEPARCRALCDALTGWEETNLQRAVALYITGLHADTFPPEFHADRAQLHGKAQPSLAQVKASAKKYQAQAEVQLGWIESMLGGSRPFVFGDNLTLADISLYQAPWFLQMIAGDDAIPDDLVAMRRWAKRIAAIGHGQMQEMTAASALKAARAAEPSAALANSTAVPEGLVPGELVSVSPLTEHSPATGELLSINAHRISLMTQNVECGRLHIHFPRLGYRVRRLPA